jgi:hypothetical protein
MQTQALGAAWLWVESLWSSTSTSNPASVWPTGCRHGPTPAALKEYEAVRLPRAQEVQEASVRVAKAVGNEDLNQPG